MKAAAPTTLCAPSPIPADVTYNLSNGVGSLIIAIGEGEMCSKPNVIFNSQSCISSITFYPDSMSVLGSWKHG